MCIYTRTPLYTPNKHSPVRPYATIHTQHTFPYVCTPPCSQQQHQHQQQYGYTAGLQLSPSDTAAVDLNSTFLSKLIPVPRGDSVLLAKAIELAEYIVTNEPPGCPWEKQVIPEEREVEPGVSRMLRYPKVHNIT